MPLEAPNLDDRRFSDIVREARALIPRYLPQWTDWNESDPGITLLHLYAWMSEQLLFRLNQVPEHHYIKFLQLLGVERKPAMPAHAELTFTLTPEPSRSVIVPKGTRVAAAEGEGDPVVFETDEQLVALGAKLEAVQTFDGTSFAVQTQANEVIGQHYPAFGSSAPEGSALYLGFSLPFPTDSEINLSIHLFDSGNPKERICDLEEQQVVLPVQVVWEYWDGARYSPLNLMRDETRAFTRSGHVVFRSPVNFDKRKKEGALAGQEDKELYWIRARVARAGYEVPPELDDVLVNTVPATAAVTVQDEVLGSSNGRPKQTFTVRNRPVFSEAPRMDLIRERKRRRPERPSLAEAQAERERIREQERRKRFLLEVDEGAGFAPWEEVEDFFESGPEDRHYLLNRTSGEVRFGDGEQGKIPVAERNNLVVRFYRHGGGARGNVGAEKITALQTSVLNVAGVTNKHPAEGGTDEETVDDAKQRGPHEIKVRERAVTPEDFELLAVQTPGARIRRACAFPLHHPQFPGVAVPGVVTVVVIPDRKDDDARPMPSEGTLQAVCAHLNKHRLLTSEVFVAPPQYKEITIEARIIAQPEVDLAEVKRQVKKQLTDYLHPLKGGADGQGWEPGADVFYSEVFRVILGVGGVRVETLRIILDGERLDIGENAEIPEGFLVFSGDHKIQVEYVRSE